MPEGMFELVQKILWAVSFIAVGGALALIFLFVFAQVIFGSHTIHKQLEVIKNQLDNILSALDKNDKNLENKNNSEQQNHT